MTTYTTIPNTDIDQDSPITQPLMTALRDNPIAIAEGDTSVSTGLFPTVLLGTVTTTSGSSQSLSSLTLTPYRGLRIFLDGISFTSSTHTFVFGGQNCWATANAGYAFSGMMEVDLGSGVFGGSVLYNVTTTYADHAFGGKTSYSTATTSITFSTSGTFDAGSIRVYGVK